MKILVFTTDVIPLPGLPTSGTALRTFGLIQGLRAHGHEVLVSVPKSALSGMLRSLDLNELSVEVRRQIDELKTLAFDSLNQSFILNELRPDAVLCGHWPAFTFQTKPSQALIVDLAGPHLLERHYQGSPNHLGATMGKLAIVASADCFIVSGPTQRLYFLSFLLRAAVPNPEKRMVEITMPLDPNVPTRSFDAFPAKDYPRVVFGGVFLPWQNPAAALEQTAETLLNKERGMLRLIGGSHPNYKIREGIYTKLFSALAKNPRVSTSPMLPYERFVEELQSNDVALDVMKWNLERELAMTIRSTTYLWSGLPVIYNDYADLGRLIRRYDAGWTVTPGAREQLSAVFDEIFSSPETVRRKSENASRLAREVFSWDRAVEPLLEHLVHRRGSAVREVDIIVDFPDNANLPVSDREPIEQHFFSRVDGLNRIECRLATHNREITKPVTFSLFEVAASSPTGPVSHNGPRKLIAQKSVASEEMKNNEWFVFDMPRIPDSAGKTFALRIESAQSDPTRCMSPWAVRGEPFPLLGLYHGGTRVDHASLCLRTTCVGNGPESSTS